MSTTPTGKRSTTPKQQRSRSQNQKKGRVQEDVCVRTSLPPLVEGPVHAILICHIPKLRWNTKHQSIARSVTIKIAWWGEDDTFATFKPQISGTTIDYHQKPCTTAKYYIRSELKQFAKYLTDAAELVLRISDSDSNRNIGTAKVQNLSILSVSNPIKGYQSIFTSKGEKLGEVLVCLRLFLPGSNDSNENLTAWSMMSDSSNPPSRRNSIGANDFRKIDDSENALRFDSADRVQSASPAPGKANETRTIPFDAYRNEQPGVKTYQDIPTNEVVEVLIERANRLREEMIKSTKDSSGKDSYPPPDPSMLNQNNNNVELLLRETRRKSLDFLDEEFDKTVEKQIFGLQNSTQPLANLNDSNESILSDLEGLENEQSLLDDLLYGRRIEDSVDDNRRKSNVNTSINRPAHGKPPTGRSRSPSLSRVGSTNRPRSTRNRSLGQSTDSDTASRVSFDMPNSDLDESGNESHDEESLSKERLHLLSFIRTARVRIDYLRLNALTSGRESPSHSSFGRTNKSKKAINYFIEYQFPVIANSRDGQKNEATEVMKIASKRFESNNDISFSHLTTYPCLFNENSVRNWWRSLLIFKIFARMSGNAGPEQIGFAVVPLRKILKAESLHFEQSLAVVDRSQINQQKIPGKVSKKFCIGHLKVILELDSDAQNFRLELDRLRLLEQSKPKKTTKGKKAKKTPKISLVDRNQQSLPRAFLSEGFLGNDESNSFNDGLVVEIYLSIVAARNIPPNDKNQHLPRNPYFVCRSFWNEQPITSVVCWGSTSPKFSFEQKNPILLTRKALDKMKKNFVVIEIWDKKVSGPRDEIIGIVKVPLEQFYISFKDKEISRVLLRAQYPVISGDGWFRIVDPFSAKEKSFGELEVFLAMGSSDQITAVRMTKTGVQKIVRAPEIVESQIESNSSLIEHHFDVMIESINGLRAFESMIWGESDCFIQYSFPNQENSKEKQTSSNVKEKFQLQTVRTGATLCTSDPTFHDSHKFRYVLSAADALHKYFYAAFQNLSPLDSSIPFEVWSRFYYPNTRDQLLAKGKLPSAKLCSMTTMLDADNLDNKAIQSFRIPLEIVRDDSKQEMNFRSAAPAYGGDLLVTVTYKRLVVKNDRQILGDRLANGSSQVCISVGVIRACGLKSAVQSLARQDNRLNYPSQVGANTYARISISFLSEMESRTTRTVARTFVPEFNHSIDFPVPLVWSDHRQQTISLAEMLEHGEMKIDLFHQINSSDNSSEIQQRKPVDIHLCYCTIPLRDLLSRHTGIKGWFSLINSRREGLTEPSEHSVGGLELFVRFAQQDDRRRVIDSAKTLGWLDENYREEENFLDDQKDLGCLLTISIDRIQIPTHLAVRAGKDRVDDRTSVFVQYRLYDKMPIITKRKKPIIDRQNLICDLQFNKEHLFLCSEPFLWYLREEKLEIQIWTSESEVFEFSENSSLSTTDRLIGSVYVDLYRLCDRKRKSHRFHAILPMFKAATKDLSAGLVNVQMTIDKSKDFNELRSRNGGQIENSNDAELDSYLENRHLNLIKNDRALRTITNNVFSVILQIQEAAHLPTVYSRETNAHDPPNPYVTFAAADSNNLCRTAVLTSTCKPIWNHQQPIKLAIEHLFNDKKSFILKVWHKVNADIETIPEKSGDKVLGFVSIDLSPLLSGLQQIFGWYNIVDTIGNVQGQLKIAIIPQEDLFELKRFKYQSDSNPAKLDSFRSNYTTNRTHTPITVDLSARSSNSNSITNNTSIIEDDKKPSYLMENLRRQLGELDVITERLKSRMSNRNDSSLSQQSTISIGRCQSVPPTNMVTPLDLPSSRTDLDSTRSNSTTIQTNISEQFPESLSGRPLMSNGINVTDMLSIHNDRIRLAAEMVGRANQLLETSKDLFTRTATPTPPVPPHVDTKTASSSPSTLPIFNATTEFQPENRSIRQTQEEIPSTHSSIDEIQYDNHTNGSSMVLNEDDQPKETREQNEHFPLASRPPLPNQRSNVNEIVSPRQTIENNDQEQHDDDEMVPMTPLNNLSGFDFDRHRMNAERSNEMKTSSTSPRVRRAIFNDDQQYSPTRLSNVLLDSNASSIQQVKQSFTSDSSLIDGGWLQEQQRRPMQENHTAHTNPSSDQRLPSRSPHLAFLDRPMPNFFPSKGEMELSIRQITQGEPNNKSHAPKTIIDRLRTKSSSDLLRGISPVNNGSSGTSSTVPSEGSNVDVKRLEKIFKGKVSERKQSTNDK